MIIHIDSNVETDRIIPVCGAWNELLDDASGGHWDHIQNYIRSLDRHASYILWCPNCTNHPDLELYILANTDLE